MAEGCDESVEFALQRYYFYVMPNVILAMCHCILLAHTIQKEYSLRGNINFQRLKKMRILYIIQQVIAISALICYILLIVVDPHTQILQHSILCKWTAYVPRLFPTFFYTSHLMALLFRLDAAFKDTSLALSRRTVHILRISISAIPVFTSFVLALDVTVPACLNTWRAPDLTEDLFVCRLPFEDMLLYKYNIIVAATLCTCTLYILLTVLFTVKLLKVLKMARKATTETDGELKVQQLILRNNVLTIVGCVSTLIGTWFVRGSV